MTFLLCDPGWYVQRTRCPELMGRKNTHTHTHECSYLIAARERPRAGSKQMATYQAVVAQTQSKQQLIKFVLLSCYTNLVCSRRSLAPTHYIHDASSMNAVWLTHTQRRPQTALLLLLSFFMLLFLSFFVFGFVFILSLELCRFCPDVSCPKKTY